MAFKLNSLVCVWRNASLGHINLNRGRQLGYLLLGSGSGGGGGGGCGGGSSGVKQLIYFSSSTYNPSSWSHWRSSCTYCYTNFDGDHIKSLNHSLLSSKAPCVLIPYPKKNCNRKDELIAAIKEKLGKGTGNEKFRFPDYCFYSLADQKLVSLNNVRSKSNIFIPDHAICIGSSHGWLAYIDPHDRALFLTNPLVSPVPPTIRLPPLETIQKDFSSWKHPFIQKLALSSPPSSDYDNDCTVMVILADDHGLAFCKLGDTSWTALEDNDNPGLMLTPPDLVYSSEDQLFYCIDSCDDSDLDAWNLRNPSSPRRIDIKAGNTYETPDYPESEKKLRDSCFRTHYLAMESHSGDILFVTRLESRVADDDGTIIDKDNPNQRKKYGKKYSIKTLRFEVFRLNTLERGWDYMTDLGGGVLFMGWNHAFHLSASDFAPEVLIPNSIYFNIDGERECYDMGIYNMQDFTVKSIFPSHLHPFNNIKHPTTPIWFTPNPENK